MQVDDDVWDGKWRIYWRWDENNNKKSEEGIWIRINWRNKEEE